MNTTKTQDPIPSGLSPVVLVTGGARRIGAAIVQQLHQAGFDVAVHYHQSAADAKALVERLNAVRANSARAFCADLYDQPALGTLVEAVYQWHQRLDGLVNNASCFVQTPIRQFDEALWDRHYALHVKAPFGLTMAACDHLAAATPTGSVVNITDIHAQKPLKRYLAYTQSKAALHMQTLQLSRELAPKIRVNAVAPGATLPPEGENTLQKHQMAAILAQIPLQRWGAPEWVAKAVVFLMQNDYITGQTITVDGGRS